MVALYSMLFGMLILAVSLLVIPFVKSQSSKKSLIFIAGFIIVFSVVVYQFSGDKQTLSNWLSGGKQHYALLEKFNELGGVDGAIKKIELRLKENPSDAQGWMIIGKLYLTQKNYAGAMLAFKKASELQPQNERAKQYYEMVKKLNK